MHQKINVGVVGATGYAGQQLVWLLLNHPNVNIEFVASHSYGDRSFSDVYKNYRHYFDQKLIGFDDIDSKLSDINLLFLALPHGLSEKFVKKAIDKNVRVIDLGADFRLDSEEVFEKWYQTKHEDLTLNKEAIYGLPELYKHKIKNARIVASPGCYPTSAILGAAPLLQHNIVHSKVIVDAKSGTSGAGRSEKTELLFAEINENFKAYGIFSHRHKPEIAQEMSKLLQKDVRVTFTPHLLPINRGILSTIYLDSCQKISQKEAYDLYKEFYKDAPFVRITEDLPQLSHVKNSNICEIAIRVNEEDGEIIVVSAIDNLIKGASGQAVQSMNIMFGFPEECGISQLSMYL